MTTETYHNSPVRDCSTCVHRVPEKILGEDWDYCRRWGTLCKYAMWEKAWCGPTLTAWRQAPPKPPRRSLRQWLYDTLWK